MATYSGQNYGAGKPERIWLGIKSALKIVIVYVLILNIIVWSFSKELVLLFIDSSEIDVIENAALFIRISAIFFIVLGVSFIFRYTIQGVGYTRLALFPEYQKCWQGHLLVFCSPHIQILGYLFWRPHCLDVCCIISFTCI